MILKKRSRIFVIAFTALPLLVGLQGCSSSADAMPPTKVDLFVLDLSTSNDKESQLNRFSEDLQDSLTGGSFGVPKPLNGAAISGPVTTIFTFIVDAAPKAEEFKLQDSGDVRKLWNEEFADDTERNAKSWTFISSIYEDYAKSILNGSRPFSLNSCSNYANQTLKPKFLGNTKRGKIVRTICGKAEQLKTNYDSLLSYVRGTNASSTDVFGMLNRVNRLVSEIKNSEPGAEITVNVSSDMQHETGDARDIPAKLKSVHLESAASCSIARTDRAKEGITFDKKSNVKINGIGNAKSITAEYGNSLIHYWQCFFNS